MVCVSRGFSTSDDKHRLYEKDEQGHWFVHSLNADHIIFFKSDITYKVWIWLKNPGTLLATIKHKLDDKAR